MLNNWRVFQENICILGMQHSGKTTLAKQLLDQIPNCPRIIISPQMPQKLYAGYGNPITSIEELMPGGAYLWVGKINERIFENICKKLMSFTNMVLVLDDAHEFCRKQKIPENFSTLINSGRNRGIVSIFLSPSPNLLHNVLLQSSQHIIVFRFRNESQIEFCRKNYLGDIGWLLFLPSLRPTKFQKFKRLDEHDFLYSNVNDDFIIVVNSDGKEIKLETISDFGTEDLKTPDEPEITGDSEVDTLEADKLPNHDPESLQNDEIENDR